MNTRRIRHAVPVDPADEPVVERRAVGGRRERRRVGRDVAARIRVERDLRHESFVGRAAADRVAGRRIDRARRDWKIVRRRLAAHDDGVARHVRDLRHRLEIVGDAAAAAEERLVDVLRRVGAQTADEAAARRTRSVRGANERAARRDEVPRGRRSDDDRFAGVVHGQPRDPIGVVIRGPHQRPSARGRKSESRDDAGLDVGEERGERRVRRPHDASRHRIVVRPAASGERDQLRVRGIDRRLPQVVLARAADERRVLQIGRAGAIELEARDRRVLRSVPGPIERVGRGHEHLDVVARDPSAHRDEAVRVDHEVFEDVALRSAEERAVGQRSPVGSQPGDEHVAFGAAVCRRVRRVVGRAERTGRRRKIARGRGAADDDIARRVVGDGRRVVFAGPADERREDQTAGWIESDDERVLVDPDAVEGSRRRRKVGREGLADQHRVAGRVDGQAAVHQLRVPAADERRVAQDRSVRAETRDERRRLNARRERRIGERREIGRCHRAADEHVAAAVARRYCRTDEVRTRTAEERRPHDAGIDDERTRRIALVDVEAVSMVIDSAESAGDEPPMSTRQLLPAHRRRLPERSALRVERQRAVVFDSKAGCTIGAEHHTIEHGAWIQTELIFEQARALVQPDVDARVQVSERNGRECGHVRSPAARIRADVEVVARWTSALADWRNVRRGAFERERDGGRKVGGGAQRHRRVFDRGGDGSVSGGETDRPIPLAAVLDEVDRKRRRFRSAELALSRFDGGEENERRKGTGSRGDPAHGNLRAFVRVFRPGADQIPGHFSCGSSSTIAGRFERNVASACDVWNSNVP